MLTLSEVLEDVANSEAFKNKKDVTVNTIGDHGETPLHWITALGDLDAAKILIEVGANTAAIDDSGNTVLHSAVLFRQAHMIQFLIDNGVDTTIRNKNGLKAIDIAIASGYKPCISLLRD